MASHFHLPEGCIPTDHSRQVDAFALADEFLHDGRQIRTVLDLGCGSGDSIEYFRGKLPGVSWTGIDIESSPEVLARTRRDGEFRTFDGVHIPRPDASVDLVFCRQVMHHVRQPLPLMQDVRRVLKPDGYLLGSTSQIECYQSYSCWGYTIHGFHALLQDAGMRLVQVRPGIDGLTLVLRRVLWAPWLFDRYFTRESPMNRLFSLVGRLRRRGHEYINARKLVTAGHFCFLAQRDDAPGA